MQHHSKAICLLWLLFSSQSQAETGPDFWQCTAQDKDKQSWTQKSNFQISAENRAIEDCKKHSKQPLSCKLSSRDCEFYEHGQPSLREWRCTALDMQAKAWPSKSFNNPDDAAIAARENCRQNSSMPDSCYVNFFSCKNYSNKD